jgi:hypothetical protein
MVEMMFMTVTSLSVETRFWRATTNYLDIILERICHLPVWGLGWMVTALHRTKYPFALRIWQILLNLFTYRLGRRILRNHSITLSLMLALDAFKTPDFCLGINV